MIHIFPNAVRIAIDRLGGPTYAAHAMAVSNTTIHSWIKNCRVPDITRARKLAELSGIRLQELRSTL
jgi:ribosome-binding protein aMBF1 (putative translation factor)